METITIKSPMNLGYEIPINYLFKMEQSLVLNGRYKNDELDTIVSDTVKYMVNLNTQNGIELSPYYSMNLSQLLYNYVGYFNSYIDHEPHRYRAFDYYRKYAQIGDDGIYEFILNQMLISNKSNVFSHHIKQLIYCKLDADLDTILSNNITRNNYLLESCTEDDLIVFVQFLKSIKHIY